MRDNEPPTCDDTECASCGRAQETRAPDEDYLEVITVSMWHSTLVAIDLSVGNRSEMIDACARARLGLPTSKHPVRGTYDRTAFRKEAKKNS